MPREPIPLRDWWVIPASEATFHLSGLQLDDELEVLRKSMQIRYRGKMIDPEDYPCKCKLMNPSQCWEEKHPNAKDHQSGSCKCRCHSTYED
jgi:hypothetical protein